MHLKRVVCCMEKGFISLAAPSVSSMQTLVFCYFVRAPLELDLWPISFYLLFHLTDYRS